MTVPSRPSLPARPAPDTPCFTAAAIVRLLGGTAVVSRAVSRHMGAVTQWRRNGIPRCHWPALAVLARRTPGARDVTLAALERHVADPGLPRRSYGQTMTPDAIRMRRYYQAKRDAAACARLPEYDEPAAVRSASSDSPGAADAAAPQLSRPMTRMSRAERPARLALERPARLALT